MVAKKAKSNLDSALRGHAGDETTLSNIGDIPSGIENGIAQLTSIKFGTYESGDMEGEKFFMAGGTVIQPSEVTVDGTKMPIAGMRTQLGPEPLCDTPKRKKVTTDDHVNWMLNQLRLLGLDTSFLEESENAEVDLEEACETLVETAPQFRFRTWASKPTKDYPNPNTNHTWKGVVEAGENVGEDEELEDEELNAEEADSGDEEAQLAITAKAKSLGIDPEDEAFEDWASVIEAIEKKSKAKSKPKSKGKKVAKKKMTNKELGAVADKDEDSDVMQALSNLAREVEIDENDFETWEELGAALDEHTEEEEPAEDEAEYEEEEEETPSPEFLAEQADEEDEGAIDALTEMAEEYELDPNEYETWADLVEAFPADEEEEEEDSVEPEKGEVYMYTPPRMKKAIECEVTYVARSKQTVNLLGENEKVYKNIAWDKILTEE